MKFSVRSVIFIMTFAICLSCGHKTSQKKTFQNKVVIGMSASPKTLDPRIATDLASARIQQLVFNSLVKKDETSKLVPDLAERWDIPDDRTYTFYLRKDVRFHNGQKLTAKDVKATFDAIRSDKLASPKKGAYDIIESIVVEDDYTITFKTKEPFAPFLINMVQGILPAGEALKIHPTDSITPIGTGPFKIKQEQPGENIILAANTDYFEGKPGLDEIEFRFIPDDSIRLMELEKGSIDFLQNNISPDALKRVQKDDRFKIVTWTGTSFYYVGFNFRTDGPIRKREVRKALALALDRDTIIKSLLGGLAEKAVGVLPADHWAFNKTLNQIPYDPPEAKKLLDAAGYPEHDGKRFSLEFKCSQNKRSQRLAEVVQAQWGNIGIDVKIKSMEWGTFYDDILHGNFQTYILSWVGVTDPDIYYSLFHSRSVPPNGRNRGFYANPEMDRLLEEGRRFLDLGKRADIYRKVQEIAAEDLPYINLWHTKNVAVMKKDLMGYQTYPAGDFDSFKQVRWKRSSEQ